MADSVRETAAPSVAPSTADAPTQARLRVLTHDLVERIKELNCLYGISRLVEQEGISLGDLLQRVVDLIPPAWQYPEVTSARIRVRTRQFTSSHFGESAWKQTETIVVGGRRVGSVEVFYLVEKPFEFEGPFLKEERDLIHGIAERLGHIIESKHAGAALHRLYGSERKLRKSLQLEMQNRVDFTRQLVHELKTPLTSLMATSQLLSEETKGTRLEKVAGYVWDSASSLNARIDELHDVIRGEIGNLTLERRPMRLDALLNSVIEETRAFARQRDVSIQLELPSEGPREVFADVDRVRQVLLNLINNAMKYAAAGKRVVIMAICSDAAVTVEVRDFGPGVPKEEMKHLFKPGYVVSRAKSTGGLGIGLTLCKLIVELHGGEIWAESTVGKGSSFFFTLPYRTE
jgi:signal transduction histidine kinase